MSPMKFLLRIMFNFNSMSQFHPNRIILNLKLFSKLYDSTVCINKNRQKQTKLKTQFSL